MREMILGYGLDFYREVCCALGSETTLEDYVRSVRASGSRWPDKTLADLFDKLKNVPSHVHVLSKCDFLHFGSTREILASGRRLFQQEDRLGRSEICLSINNRFINGTPIPSADAWIEGCAVGAQIACAGQNVIVGADVDEPLEMPVSGCLDVLPGRDRAAATINFVRCYHTTDDFHGRDADCVQLDGKPLDWWLAQSGADVASVWDSSVAENQRCVWNARLFPAEKCSRDYRRWLWMLTPESASREELSRWANAERYSFEEMARLADVDAFHARRVADRAADIRTNLRRMLRGDSGFSAGDLAYAMEHRGERDEWLSRLIAEARWQAEQTGRSDPAQAFAFSRIIHTLASAVETLADSADTKLATLFPGGQSELDVADRNWLAEAGLQIHSETTVAQWANQAKQLAFDHMRASNHVEPG